MICQFCRQDVKDPCHDVPEMQQRASEHIPRCENALKSTQGMGHEGAHARDVQGRH